jgi:hypothetical protein
MIIAGQEGYEQKRRPVGDVGRERPEGAQKVSVRVLDSHTGAPTKVCPPVVMRSITYWAR